MKYTKWATVVAFVVGLLLSGCGSGSSSPELLKSIATRATPAHRRIPGTHMLLAAPAEFQLDTAQHLLRRSVVQFVQVVELPGVEFTDYLAQLKKELAAQRDIPLEALQQTTYNGHPAVFLTQPYRNGPGLEVALLAFGDNRRMHLVLGVYPKLLPGAAADTRHLLLTAHYNPALRVQEQQVRAFEADMLDTKFEKLGQQGRWTIYAPQGRIGADGDTAHATLFRVTTLPPMPRRSDLQDVALAVIREYRTAAQVSNVQETNTTVNGHYAYQNILTFSYAGKTGQALVLLLSTPTGVVVFDGRAYDQPYERMSQLERIAKTIRLTGPAS